MKTILFTLHELGYTAIDLGKCGENNVRQIEIDLSEWMNEYPGASVALYISQPNTTVYLAATKLEEGILKWPILNTYTATPGFGSAEIVMSGKNGERLKSATANIFVSESMSEDEQGEAPEYMKPYADQVAENAAKVEKAVEEIKGIVVQSGNVPTGGTAGDVLVKQSNTYGDATWKSLTASDVGALPSGGTAKNSEKLGGKASEAYLTTDKVVNNFTTTEEGFVADARALKELRYKFTHIIWNSPRVTMSFGVGETVAFTIENCLNANELTPISVLDMTSANPLLITNNWASGTTRHVRITNISGVALKDISVRVVCINLDGI